MPILARYLLPVALTASSTTATPNQLGVADLSSNSVTFVLPTNKEIGDRVGLKLGTASGTRTATLSRDGSNTIEGATSVVLYIVGDYIEVEWTGSIWIIVVDGRIAHYAKMYNSVSQSVGSGSIVPMVFDTVEFDNAGLASASSDNFTIRRAGKYRIEAFGDCPNLDDTEVLGILIYKNGSSIATQGEFSPAANIEIEVITSWEGTLAASDVITIQIFHNEGLSQNFSNATDKVSRATVEEIRK